MIVIYINVNYSLAFLNKQANRQKTKQKLTEQIVFIRDSQLLTDSEIVYSLPPLIETPQTSSHGCELADCYDNEIFCELKYINIERRVGNGSASLSYQSENCYT